MHVLFILWTNHLKQNSLNRANKPRPAKPKTDPIPIPIIILGSLGANKAVVTEDRFEGCIVGFVDGFIVGRKSGLAVGLVDGFTVGFCDGYEMGLLLGFAVG